MSAAEHVLVTGASSLLGAGVVRALLGRGATVRCFQRGEPSPAVVDAGAEVVRGDVRDAAAVARAADGCTAIVHVAAKVGVSGPYDEYRAINVDGTANIVSAARAAGIDRLVHISTPSVAHTGDPIIGGLADPAAPDGHTSAYSATKAEAERVALAAADDRLGVVAIRPHLIWGPGDTQLVGRIVERSSGGTVTVINGGTALIDTTYIDNAVDAVVAALDHVAPGAPCSGRPYVIANYEPRPVGELLVDICAAAGIDAELRSVPLSIAAPAGGLVEWVYARRRPDDEPPMTRFLAEQLGTAHWFDPRPARDDLGWTPNVSIDDGLARLGRWFADGAPKV